MALIIFDLDGTLAKTNEDIADAVNVVRQVRGLQPLSYEKLTSLLGCGIFNLMKQAMP
ncbi:MAG: HAD hydrolase-like protein, partial [Victivallales bacterium]|nr:HAD hydrolase-like protein [Victivallales bacterium]